MITKFPLLIFGHPFLSLSMIVCAGLGISWFVQTRAGRTGLLRARKFCLACFSVCLSLLILDGVAAWYARGLNPDGYALLYVVAAALVLFPLAATSAILTYIFKLTLQRNSTEEQK